MAKTNRKTPSIHTHEGARAKRIALLPQLRRTVLSCLLWEKEFYESGASIQERIVDLVGQTGKLAYDDLATLAIEAREQMHLRHVPLLLVSAMAANGYPVAPLIPKVVRRADELAELVSIHCRVNNVGPDKAKKVLSAQMKRGLAAAFLPFDEYQLAKYNRKAAITLRDVMRLVHPRPANKTQAELWKRLTKNELTTPDTWEVALSGGGDKREEFTRLMSTGKLGYMAVLRNLRNMEQAGVDPSLVRDTILARKGAHNVLPFRYLAAARHAPRYERELDTAMMASIDAMPKLPGETLVLVDISISMNERLSSKSELTRMDVAAALASIVPSDNVRVFSFSAGNMQYHGDRWDGKPVSKEVPPRRGMAGIDAVINSQRRGGTLLGRAVTEMNAIKADRLIVITDEQSHDPVPDPVHPHAYLINVASARNGVGYGRWTHIDGFSENVLRYIAEAEQSGLLE